MDEWIKENAMSIITLLAAGGAFVGAWSVVRARVKDNVDWIKGTGNPHVINPHVHRPAEGVTTREVCDERHTHIGNELGRMNKTLDKIWDKLENGN